MSRPIHGACSIALMLLLVVVGCMEQPLTPSPQKLPSGLSAQVKAELADRNAKLSALAKSCGALSDIEAGKLQWNTGYHQIVGNSVDTLTKLTHAATPATLFKELEAAYGP